MSKARRETADLTAYPDLVVVYLGMRVNTLAGIRTVFGFGPKISHAVDQRPDGLLLHENVFYSLRHVGMREYWRDFASLEKWTRSEPHRIWWQEFLRNTGGTGFWHETYLRQGGFESVYIDILVPTGMGGFAPRVPARGSMFSSRRRMGMGGEAPPAPLSETDLYGR